MSRMLTSLLAAGLALPLAAAAQTPATAPAPLAVAHPTAARMGGGNSERVEQRISDMRAKLKITPAEQPQWDSFVAVMRDNSENMRKVLELRTGSFKTMTAVDNMTSYEAIAQQHAANLQKLVPAFQTLYTSLSDVQKHTADQMFRGDVAARAAKG